MNNRKVRPPSRLQLATRLKIEHCRAPEIVYDGAFLTALALCECPTRAHRKNCPSPVNWRMACMSCYGLKPEHQGHCDRCLNAIDAEINRRVELVAECSGQRYSDEFRPGCVRGTL